MADKTVRIWSLQDKTQVAVLKGHDDFVFSVAITNDSNYIVSGGYDKTVRVRSLQSKRQEAILQGHTNLVYSIAITSDNTGGCLARSYS